MSATEIGTIKKEQGHYVQWNGKKWVYIPINRIPANAR